MLEPSGLKVTQYSLLRHLAQIEPVKITELAKFMRIDRTTLNRNMKPLIEAGFIEVNTGVDPRSRQILLTAEGKSVLSSAAGLWEKAQTAMREYLGEAELEQYKKLIAKLEALVP
jgi:Transcriptional regulators